MVQIPVYAVIASRTRVAKVDPEHANRSEEEQEQEVFSDPKIR